MCNDRQVKSNVQKRRRRLREKATADIVAISAAVFVSPDCAALAMIPPGPVVACAALRRSVPGPTIIRDQEATRGQCLQ